MTKIKVSEGIFPISHFGPMGKIHSVFENSFNLEFKEGLINVSANENEYLSSFGLALESWELKELQPMLQQGNLVKLYSDSLTVYSTKGIKKIRWEEHQVQSLSIQSLHLSSEQCRLLINELHSQNLEQKVGLSLTEAELFVDRLRQKNLSPQKWQATVAYFIGRGKGLTPSGDDLLAAYLIMLQILLPAYSKKLVASIALDNFSTNDISKEYLKYALKGYSNSLVYQLLLDLQAGKSQKNIQQNIEKIRKIGHTSGTDLCYGLYLALVAAEVEAV